MQSKEHKILVRMIRDGTRVVCTMSSSPGSEGSFEVTLYLHTPPAMGCKRITTKGGDSTPNGILSAEPRESMWMTAFVCEIS